MSRRINEVAEDRRLQSEVAVDRIAQERGPADTRFGRTAKAHVHCRHPDTGLDVVFIPGELLPDWAPGGD